MNIKFDFEKSINKTKESFGLSKKDIFSLYRSALSVSQEVIKEMKKGLKEDDYTKIRDAAHKLKSASGSLRLDEIYELSSKIEGSSDQDLKKGLNKDMKIIKEYFSSLDDALTKVS
jgi:HPt (histidine-containing phosphotransfer) domain-containing protein